MKVVYSMLVFCIVLFIYLHVYFHLKVSNDLEVYEIEQPSKEKLEEICDIRQPVLFDFHNDRLLDNCSLKSIENTYNAFDVKVRNVKDKDDNEGELYMPLALNAALHLFQNDSEQRYYTENNSDFLEETGLLKCFQYNDAFLRPYMVSNCEYDLICGSIDTETPLRYELTYRSYFYVNEGSVRIKLLPPKSSKYLYTVADYDNFEFRSLINPWNVKQQYKPDYDKVKSLEIELKQGQILFLPAFWWYSIRFSDQACICAFKYRTYMNTTAILPQLFMKSLQAMNVKHEIAKTVDLGVSPTEKLESLGNE